MKNRLISLILVMLFLTMSAAMIPVSAAGSEAEHYLASMSAEDKISTMMGNMALGAINETDTILCMRAASG